ncbi:MAG: hypothetical protein ACYC5O_11335 [Anaerolineae bacterium]
MIAINWFEITMRSADVAVAAGQLSPECQTGQHPCGFRVTWEDRSSGRTYHLIPSLMPGMIEEHLDLRDRPSLANRAVEQGFAERLHEVGFAVRRSHVGALALRPARQYASVRPGVYVTREGIRFRAYWGFGHSEQPRWGLVLNYAVAEQFVVTLEHHVLRAMAATMPVVPVAASEEHAPNARDGWHLESATGGTGTLCSSRGSRQSVRLSEWTIPGSRSAILEFVRRTESGQAQRDVSAALLQGSLELTPDRRMNTSLARDQVLQLQGLLSDRNLYQFTLPFLGHPVVRLAQEPLVVE